MTGYGIFKLQNRVMLNIELARIIQADREREIEARLRDIRNLRPSESTYVQRSARQPIRPNPDQRPASTAAFSR
jgi:hypothetical protein